MYLNLNDYTECDFMLWYEDIFDVSSEQATFAYPRITYDNHFELYISFIFFAASLLGSSGSRFTSCIHDSLITNYIALNNITYIVEPSTIKYSVWLEDK